MLHRSASERGRPATRTGPRFKREARERESTIAHEPGMLRMEMNVFPLSLERDCGPFRRRMQFSPWTGSPITERLACESPFRPDRDWLQPWCTSAGKGDEPVH